MKWERDGEWVRTTNYNMQTSIHVPMHVGPGDPITDANFHTIDALIVDANMWADREEAYEAMYEAVKAHCDGFAGQIACHPDITKEHCGLINALSKCPENKPEQMTKPLKAKHLQHLQLLFKDHDAKLLEDVIDAFRDMLREAK